ncbi:hypothetical protein HA402_001494 [Bradysia odoriphaga]|nr:hypothetical protein HA402_001494 [Bradysia odoriphaga]
MALKITLLFALIVSAIELVCSVPISGDLTDVVNTGDSRGSGANPNGLLHGFRNIVDNPLCGTGLGCDDCVGPLSGLQPTLGSPINSVGLGVNCQGNNCGGNDGGVPIGNGNGDGDVPIGNCNGDGDSPIGDGNDDGDSPIGDGNDDGDSPIGDGNDDGGCSCHEDAVQLINDGDDGHDCHDCDEDEIDVGVDVGEGECE